MDRRTQRARRRTAVELAAQRGVTLIEIMIVVIIMALIATGVAVAVIPAMERARIKTARSDVAAIRSAVQMYLADHSTGCPNVEDLKSKRYVDKGKRTTDPWDRDFVIQCIEGDDPEVYSLGPDGSEGGCDPGHTTNDSACEEEEE
ncbi:MAG: type II secretion system protein GspG [Deltaproteobacteria bacterium]|nr:type II secretion system protein GspG [Deltaproteobacteria bacterium]